ncbi:MAG: metal-dependent hydrolase, partial [Gemmatimonadetes bacterium]|nr:metal-dependent hydrolase [Gemmatimonadota bacterium]
MASLRGEYFALAFRRGSTHGVPAMVVLPFLVVGAVLAWDRWVRRRRAPDAPPAIPREVLFLSFLGVLAHTPMDWLNVYGTRFWLPFSGSWSYGDTLFIVDPWLWLALGGAVFLARSGSAGLWAFLGLATTALMLLGPVPRAAAVLWVAGVAGVAALRRWRRLEESPLRRQVARVALASSMLYIALMVSASTLGRSRVEVAAAAAGLDPVDVLVSPAAANPFAA